MSHIGAQSSAGKAPGADPKNTRLIRGQVIPVQHTEMAHSRLLFYEDNPRVHSTLHAGGREPTQSEIEAHLIGLDHVKKLAANIEAEGGLHDAVIVRGGAMQVVEGNCRLAAYRLLSRTKGAHWDRMRCEILPADISDDLIFSLLAQYHINGKLAWLPFEQAGFFFREYAADQSGRAQRDKIAALAEKGGGVSMQRAQHLVDTYGFMLEHDDVVAEHWSHYDEYLKSRDIRKAREAYPDKLDDRFVATVPNVPAEDIRKKLAKVCTQDRVLKKFVDGSLELEEAFERYRESGADADAYQKFHRFRTWLADDAVRTEIAQYAGQERQKVMLEVKKLELLITRLHRTLTAEDEKPKKRRR